MNEWWLMNQKIKEVPLYVYLGIILTPDIDFTQHIKVILQAAHRQGREALLLGVRRGELHPVRARKVWCVVRVCRAKVRIWYRPVASRFE